MAEDPKTFVRYVARRLRQLRKSNGVTGEKLAELLGVPAQNVRRIEAGGQNITVKTLARIAGALGYGVKITFVRRKK